MSLFLQTLVLRGICSVSRSIAKNVLRWDDAVADRAYKMRGEEANEIEIGNFNTL
jgi:hypothetical protein